LSFLAEISATWQHYIFDAAAEDYKYASWPCKCTSGKLQFLLVCLYPPTFCQYTLHGEIIKYQRDGDTSSAARYYLVNGFSPVTLKIGNVDLKGLCHQFRSSWK
jgi:hypothetical protein